MSAFICQISEADWDVAKIIGLYGNREKKPDLSGDLRTVDKMSIIRDLIAIKPGDIILFHVVKTSEGESRIHGIFQATSTAFYSTDKVWNNDIEVYPYRFSFKPHPEYLEFASRDSFIYVSELYKKIESKDIWSLATLENERNMERRAVRKISKDDANEITKLILKHPMFKEHVKIQNNFYSNSSTIPLENKIVKIGAIENSIKAFLMSELKNNSICITSLFGNVIDYMNETFVAQTTRKLFDLLIISSPNSKGKDYYIVEAKRDNYSEDNLSQLLNYIDLFKLKNLFQKNDDRVIGYALAQKYPQELIELVANLKYFNIITNLELLKYRQDTTGSNAIIQKISTSPITLSNKIIPVKEIDNFTDEINLFPSNIIKIENLKYNDIEIIRIYLQNTDKTEFQFLKDYMKFTNEVITNEYLINIFKIFNSYINDMKHNEFFDCSLHIKFVAIEQSAYQIIKSYNKILKRPKIILSPL